MCLMLLGEIDFLIEKIQEAFYFPSALVIVAKIFEKTFLRSFNSKYVFQVTGN